MAVNDLLCRPTDNVIPRNHTGCVRSKPIGTRMHRTAYVLLLFAALFWGGNAVAAKFAAGHVSPMLLTWMRWFIVLCLLYAIGRKNLAKDQAVVRENMAYLLIMGGTGLSIFNALLYTALNFTTAINASILQAAIPMVIFVLNFALFRTRVSSGQAAGFALTVVGVMVIAGQGDIRQLMALQVNFGDLLMLAAVATYGAYSVALRKMPKMHWQSMMIVMSAGALMSASIFTLAELAVGYSQWPDMTGWIAVAYAALFPALLSQTFYIRGNALIGANRAGLFVNLVPVFGTILSVLILFERFHLFHAVALVLVFAGIWMAERKS